MDIALLKTFLQVARTRHFGRSAESLFITQSAVSARIKLLEDILGVELFVRKRNDIHLTPAGNRFLQHAETLVKAWERARQAVALDSERSASLAVGCVFDLWRAFARKWVAELRARSPDIALQIEIQTTEVLVQRLSLGLLDMAFVFDPPQAPDLEMKQVAKLPLMMVCANQGLSAKEAMLENYVMVDWGNAFANIHAEKYPDLLAPALRTNSGEVALSLILSTKGAGYLPRELVEVDTENGVLFEVNDAPVINRMAYAVYRPENVDKEPLLSAMLALGTN